MNSASVQPHPISRGMPYVREDTVDLKEKERRIDEAYHVRRWPYSACAASHDKPRPPRSRRRRSEGGDSDDDDTYDSLPARSYARTKPRPRRLSGEYAGGESDDSSYNTYDSRHERGDKHTRRSTRSRRSAGRRRGAHVFDRQRPVFHSYDVVHRHYFPHYHRVTHINTYTSLSSYSPWPGKTYGRMVELIRVEQRADKAGNTSAATGS